MARTPLTHDTERLVELDFPSEDRAAATELLEMRCGEDLPLIGSTSPEAIERIRFAVLKLSHGSIEELPRHIAIACTDWRDALVAAGFGHQVLAHRVWFKERIDA
jgi:hypothetical protein